MSESLNIGPAPQEDPGAQAARSAESYRLAALDPETNPDNVAILNKRAELTDGFANSQREAANAGEQVPGFNSVVRDKIREDAPKAVSVDEWKARTEAAQEEYRKRQVDDARREVIESFQSHKTA